MNFSRCLCAAALAVFLLALLLRWPGLGDMPFHTDEANNALLLEESLSAGGFQYRPHEHHGPTLFWLAGVPCKILGVSSMSQMEAWALRLTTVWCGALAAASVLLLAPWLGKVPALLAALMVCVAAPFHYYSRVFIHESLLLLLTVWLLAALWRWRESGRWRWAVVSGALAGLMVATKENAAVTVVLVGWPFWLGFREKPLGFAPRRRDAKLIFGAGLVALAVVLVCIGPENLWRAMALHTRRGLGAEHHWPWWQFFAWFGSWHGPGLPWSVWLGSLAATTAVLFQWREPAVRILATGLAGLLLFHCALPYKTPWLMLEPLLLLTLLAGVGLDGLRRRRSLMVGGLVLGVFFALLLAETWARSFHHQARADNPLAYAPSAPAMNDLARDLAARCPPDAVIQVVAGDYWPLPWVLRKFPNAGFWPGEPRRWFGDVLICAPEIIGRVPDAGAWRFTPYALRPGVIVLVGFRKGAW
ncbi:MAG: glycosyltransferase family 39 protein [Verrucomicrobiales bacterium]|jgi:4-amino-4-deoxy-L-arabinose transferase-like glycosyltransferase|nr:glycosyltransferase family 39 protein [Verrucomicrobiales bacterium]